MLPSRAWLAILVTALSTIVWGGPAATAQDPSARRVGAPDASLWPEEQRAFLQDGPAWLLASAERQRLLAANEAERAAQIAAFLERDPISETPENELAEGIRRRRLLFQTERLPPADDRARLLFLLGPPAQREKIDCTEVFRPLEIWSWGGGRPPAVVYEPAPSLAWRLWLPSVGKRVLYTEEMEYFLEQWEDYTRSGQLRAERFDRQICPRVGLVDQATGVRTLTDFMENRPQEAALGALLAAPDDLAGWARAAATTAVDTAAGKVLGLEDFQILFPAARGQRIVTRFLAVLPAGAPIELVPAQEKPLIRLAADGVIEQDGQQFDTFRTFFEIRPPDAGVPLALAVERALRPGRSYVLRLEVRDEVGGAVARVTRGFRVPSDPQPVPEPPVPEVAVAELERSLDEGRLAGQDSLVLMPPTEEVIIGLFQVQALVSGERIQKVVFLLNGVAQFTRARPPYAAELRLSNLPEEVVVRVEGYDASGVLVAADELVLNQPRGALRVRLVEPARGARGPGRMRAKAEVIVPEGRRVERLEFQVDGNVVQTLERPPWEATVEVPGGGDLSYVTAVAVLDDGSRAEDVRFLNTPEYLEQVDVNLVELYTTVTDDAGRFVTDLEERDFKVFESDRPQKLARFELVEDLPLTLGIVLDTSGSMAETIGEAQRAAAEFLRSIVGPRDSCFALSFASRATLVMPRTQDVEAVATALAGLRAEGATSIHDALIYSLYYFRGTSGRRGLVLLSDGEDTASSVPFRDALEYARRSGVAIYPVGLGVGGAFKLGEARRRLETLAEETGGRAFFIKRVEELHGVYDEIERELRSQYLLAYASDRPPDGQFREVRVEARGGKLKARTIRGYYP